MATESRIPKIRKKTKTAMKQWFREMAALNFLNHFDDDPNDIVDHATGQQLFTPEEANELKELVHQMRMDFGDDEMFARLVSESNRIDDQRDGEKPTNT